MGSAAAAAATLATPGYARYVSRLDKIRVAHIGCGGKGESHVGYMMDDQHIVALADVDEARTTKMYGRLPDVPKFRDWREMLEKHAKEIDAVVIATPDHMHTAAAVACMELGKHVYVEKPLAHTVYESRLLEKAAKRYYVQTQMGNQGRSGDGVRDLYELVWSGAIGAVKEIHCQTNRPLWPQGIAEPLPEQPVPDSMSWDLWLGPAPCRAYNEGYAPFNWRGWWDFGCGALGDMGCHIMDPPYWVLGLGAPTSVECVAQEGKNCQTGPSKSHIQYDFPPRMVNGKLLPSVVLHWYDGGYETPRPEDIPADEEIWDTLFVGEKGYITCKTYGEEPTLLPKKRFEGFQAPPPHLERVVDEDHRLDWLRAIRTGRPAGSNFGYAGPFTEIVLLGNLSLRAEGRIKWDSANMKVTNNCDANNLLRMEYRKGWELPLTL
jgi:predicted dehydrogenase